MKCVFIAAIAAIIARGILGLISPAALDGRERPKPGEPYVQVSTEGPPGTVSGRVADAKTGEPLIDARVVLQGTALGAAADMSGKYLITHVPTGKHELCASYMCYRQLRTTVTLDSITGLRVDFHLAAIHYAPLQ